jgi:hypothetical protein
MKPHHLAPYREALVKGSILLFTAFLFCSTLKSQTCPTFSNTGITTFGNTYYPGNQANVSAGSTSITLGAAGYGTTPISNLDVLLIIQMQGAQINTANANTYGSGTGTGSGYLNNGQLMAGRMEYIVAANAVPLGGGTLNITSGLVNSYQNSNYGANGQYRYQVIRVPVYYHVTLNANITVPRWNGRSGGVLVLAATNNLDMNGRQIIATGMGFRGGGGRNFSPGSPGTYTDYVALSTGNTCASKGEGIAGTPRYLNNNGAFLDAGAAVEGYPSGSFDRGAPGNAGGGATDGNPASNSNNAGGGGGSNGGTGGGGGNSWSSNRASGGRGGSSFAQVTPSRFVMGGGGGAGSSDGGTGTPGAGFASSGAAGGGIVMIYAGAIVNTGTIVANGAAPNTTLANDGSGGGGAGGSVLVIAGSGVSGITVNANGSNGASNTGAGSPHGTGAGGGGGVIYSNYALNGASSATGGAAGTTAGATPNYGATTGAAGIQQIININQTPVFPLFCNTLLAVKFLSVHAGNHPAKPFVNWTVADETDVQEYIVERSADGIAFSAIATVAQKPSGGKNNQYHFPLKPLVNDQPVAYYRIQVVNTRGQRAYSQIVEVKGFVCADCINDNTQSGIIVGHS